MYEVAKKTNPTSKAKYTVQMRKGLMNFRTLRAANEFSEGMRKNDIEIEEAHLKISTASTEVSGSSK